MVPPVPPHADCRSNNTDSEPPSAQQVRLRFFDPPSAAYKATNANGSHTANANVPGCMGCGGVVCIAEAVGAVIVSVEVAAVVPSVKDAVVSEHVGVGDGPATTHVN